MWNVVQIKTPHTNISVLKSVYFALYHSYLTYSILNWGRANKMTLLPSIRLQNEAVRTLEYNKIKQLYSIPSTKFQKYLIYFNCQLPNSCAPLIMVDYLITLITTLPRLHQSTNIKQDLLLCNNIIDPE